MYIVDSDEATSWPARWAYIPSFKLNTGHFSCQSPSPKVIFGYSKYPSANQLNVERTIHQLAAKKNHAQHFGGISQRHVAGCLMLLDVTIPIISLIISYTFKFDQPLPAISFLRLDFSRPASLKTFSSSVSEFSVISTKAFSRRSLWWRSLLSKSPEEIKKYWHKFEDV